MQKIGKKASILLWAIFLSMTLIIAFTSINYQIRQNLQKNLSFAEKVKNNNEKNLILKKAIENNEFDETKLKNNEKIIFEWDNIINKGLKKNETLELKNYWGISSNINIKLIEWWPIYYYNSVIEWIVSKNLTLNTWSWEINIKNIWWYAKVLITNENKFENWFKKYKIITDYWVRSVLKESWEITIN